MAMVKDNYNCRIKVQYYNVSQQLISPDNEQLDKCIYDIYYNDKKLSKNKSVQVSDRFSIKLIEQNIAMSRFWFWLLLFYVIASIFSSLPPDFKNNTTRRVQEVSIVANSSGDIVIVVDYKGNIINIENVTGYEIVDSFVQDLPKAKRRLKSYKIIFWIGLVLLIVVIGLIAGML